MSITALAVVAGGVLIASLAIYLGYRYAFAGGKAEQRADINAKNLEKLKDANDIAGQRPSETDVLNDLDSGRFGR